MLLPSKSNGGALAIVLAVVAIVVVAAIALIGWRASRLQRVELVDTLKGQIIELEAVRQQLQQRRVPDDWKVGMFIASRTLNHALDTLEGSRIRLADVPGMTFEVLSLDAAPRSGSTRVEVVLRASSERRPQLSVRISGSALLLLREVRQAADGVDTAHFSLSMLDIAPQLDWRNLTVGGTRLVNGIVSSRATERLADGLALNLPLRVPAIVPLQLDKAVTIQAGASSYDLRLSMPPSTIDASFVLATPIATPQGIWILGGDRPALDLPSRDSLPNDVESLRERVAQLERDIDGQLARVLDPAADTALWISSAYAASIFQSFNALPDEQRRIDVEVGNASGTLVERSFNVLNQPARFTSSLQSGAGTLQIGQVQTTWTAGKGLGAAIPVKADATAQVEAHVFPPRILGGSRQIDATLSGAAADTLDVALGLRAVSHGAHQALVIGPVVGCDEIDLTLETATVPTLGIRQSLPLTDIPVNGVVLLDTAPRHLPRDMAASPRRIAFVGEPAWITTTWKNPRVEIGERGYLIRSDFTTQLDSVAPTEHVGKQALAAAFQQAWALETKPTCPARRSPVVLLNGIDIAETDDIASTARLIMGGLGGARRR
ncbi:hypothetical protein IP90_00415 [Luteimonas cucumeris]|uniref:Uncharacterized protein n=1 Tax=Luteimonas cucumeris TaxID=985012 RepID=A0A562LEW3_9GAMM|nr:hypothetical protein [Luteimonas cucumeris]TWI06151.1 hypothetical protein IP90_00415 [Luteimonas cucumeris]